MTGNGETPSHLRRRRACCCIVGVHCLGTITAQRKSWRTGGQFKRHEMATARNRKTKQHQNNTLLLFFLLNCGYVIPSSMEAYNPSQQSHSLSPVTAKEGANQTPTHDHALLVPLYLYPSLTLATVPFLPINSTRYHGREWNTLLQCQKPEVRAKVHTQHLIVVLPCVQISRKEA